MTNGDTQSNELTDPVTVVWADVVVMNYDSTTAVEFRLNVLERWTVIHGAITVQTAMSISPYWTQLNYNNIIDALLNTQKSEKKISLVYKFLQGMSDEQ